MNQKKLIILLFVFFCLFLNKPSFVSGSGKRPHSSSNKVSNPDDYIYSSDDMAVTFIDVGEGLCVFIESPSGDTMLYDAGGTPDWMETDWDPGARIVVPFLKQKKVESIEHAVMSHSHGDHIGGYKAVLENFNVHNFYDPGFIFPSPVYISLLEDIRTREINYNILNFERKKEIDLGKEIDVKVFNPEESRYFKNTGSDCNNNSLVLKLIYDNVSFLFTGDIEKEAEILLARKYRNNLKATVLQVAHHGSNTSSTGIFLKAVSPKTAVISCGSRKLFSHPDEKVLYRVSKINAEVYSTNICGDITVITNGRNYAVQTEK